MIALDATKNKYHQIRRKFRENENPLNPLGGEWKLSIVLFIELIGTFLLVTWICLPAVLAFGDPNAGFLAGTHFKQVWAMMFTPWFTISAYVTLGIVLVVYAFRGISANFNPAVTIVSISRKNVTLFEGSNIIVVQMIGGVAAGFFLYYLALADGVWSTQSMLLGFGNLNQTLGAIIPQANFYVWWAPIMGAQTSSGATAFSLFYVNGYQSWMWVIEIFMEMLLTGVLLASIYFGTTITEGERPWVIAAAAFIVICIGWRTGNYGLNPARIFGPAFAGTIMSGAQGSMVDSLQFVWIFILGEVMAALVVAWLLNLRDKKNQDNSNYQITKDEYYDAKAQELIFKSELYFSSQGKKTIVRMNAYELIKELNEYGDKGAFKYMDASDMRYRLGILRIKEYLDKKTKYKSYFKNEKKFYFKHLIKENSKKKQQWINWIEKVNHIDNKKVKWHEINYDFEDGIMEHIDNLSKTQELNLSKENLENTKPNKKDSSLKKKTITLRVTDKSRVIEKIEDDKVVKTTKNKNK